MSSRAEWFSCDPKHFWDDPEAAWNTLYPFLYRVARRRGVPEQDAQDLVIETIFEHQQRFPACPEGSDPMAYAMGILLKHIADWYRGRYRHPPTEELESLETSLFHQQEQLVTYREEEDRKILLACRHKLQKAWATCPEQCRQVIRLRFWEGLTFPEIATLMGRAEGTVKCWFFRGLEHLRKEMLGNDNQ